MALVDDLRTALENYGKRLKEISAAPQPNYSLDGETWSWLEYQTFLIEKMAELRRQIQEESGPIEIRSRGMT